jgi:hypothetical protein
VKKMLAFFGALCWECLQNLPVIVLFVAAVWLWRNERRAAAVWCVLAGAVAGSLIIRWTEPLTSGYHETAATTIANMVVMSVLQVPFVAYLAAQGRWSQWKMDLVLGGLAGAILALVQGLTSSGSPLAGIILHSVSLAVACALILIAIRKIKDYPLPKALVGAALVAVAMTFIISVIDYSYLLFAG